MKPTKKQLQEIQDIEKKVASVFDNTDEIFDEITGMVYPKKTTEKKSRQIEIKLSFAYNSASLKFQLNKQGLELSDEYLLRAEAIKFDLHNLSRVGILTEKQLWKCFTRLSKKICKKVVNSQLKDGEIAKHVETIKG